MTAYIFCWIACFINLGAAIYSFRNLNKVKKSYRDLGRLEGFIEGVKCATETGIKIKESTICMN